MSITLAFITKNKDKWNIGKNVLSQYGVELIQVSLETPEIQNENVEEIAEYSATFAANNLNAPVIKTDAGYYIEALNGFPGPYVKYINKWLKPSEIIKMMEGKENRKVMIKETIALAYPDGKFEIFNSETFGVIVETAQGTGSTFDQVLQRNG